LSNKAKTIFPFFFFSSLLIRELTTFLSRVFYFLTPAFCTKTASPVNILVQLKRKPHTQGQLSFQPKIVATVFLRAMKQAQFAYGKTYLESGDSFSEHNN